MKREDGEPSDSGLIPVALSSEAPVERWDWWEGERYFEVLSHKQGEVDLSYAKDGLPFLFEHYRDVQVGKIHDVRIDDDGLIRGEIEMGNHPDAAWIEKDIRAGIRQKVSIAYDPGEEYEVQPAKEKGGVPTRTYRNWMLYEGSTVSIPADYDAAGIGRSRAVERNEAAFRRMMGEGSGAAPGGAAPAASNGAPEHREVAMAGIKPDTAPPAPGVNHDAEREAVRASERERVKTLRSLAKIHGMPERAEAWIDSGATVDAAIEDVRKAQEAGEVQAADGFVRSGSGPLQRDGSPKKFESFGEQMLAVIRSQTPGNRVDPRLLPLQERASGLAEAQGETGGFAVQVDFLGSLLDPMWETGQILPRVRRFPVGANSNGMEVNLVDETSRATGSRSGGVQAYWASEADTVTASKPKLRRAKWDLKKLIAICYLTEELDEDAAAFGAFTEQAFRDEMQFMVEDSIINGDGAGKPLGIVNAGCFVAQAIEGGQTIANTPASIVANAGKMKTHLPPKSWPNAVWLMNPDFSPSLLTATLGGTSAAFPVYMPPNGLSAAPFGTLLGREIVENEYCAAVGTPGDIILADLSQYWAIEKGGLKSASSVHVRFLYGENTLRFTYRIDGQPSWAKSVTPYKGSTAKSPFVGLATRS